MIGIGLFNCMVAWCLCNRCRFLARLGEGLGALPPNPWSEDAPVLRHLPPHWMVGLPEGWLRLTAEVAGCCYGCCCQDAISTGFILGATLFLDANSRRQAASRSVGGARGGLTLRLGRRFRGGLCLLEVLDSHRRRLRCGSSVRQRRLFRRLQRSLRRQ